MRIEQPAKLALLMVVSRGAAKRELPRQGRPLVMGRTVSRAVDQSSERAASTMIDVEGRTRLAGQGSVLRGCRMISLGKIAALTQVRMRADLTTFFGSRRRAQELVEHVAVPWTRPPRDSFRLFGHARAPVLYKTGALCCRVQARRTLPRPFRVLGSAIFDVIKCLALGRKRTQAFVSNAYVPADGGGLD